MSEQQERRRYDSPVRRQRAAETRARILTAGAEVLHQYSISDWGALTVRAVAERAGVTERTVYRYFANERALRDAVMAQLESEAEVALEELTFDDLADVTTKIFEFVSSFPVTTRTPDDPTLVSASRRQHDALRNAVSSATASWSEVDRSKAAALFDVLWSMGTYERLVADWGLEPADAVSAATWVIGLMQDAIVEGRGPGT